VFGGFYYYWAQALKSYRQQDGRLNPGLGQTPFLFTMESGVSYQWSVGGFQITDKGSMIAVNDFNHCWIEYQKLNV